MTAYTIIVTGASRGLGAAAARILGGEGVNVVLNARSTDDLQAVADEIDAQRERVLVVPGDAGREEDCRDLVSQTVEHFGRLDGLINNAGVLQPIATVADADPRQWQTNIAVNLLGPFYLTHYALPHLRQARGRVINVSSGAAVGVTQGWSAYCAAKAGLNHFTRVLAAEEPDVVALSFRPGVVDTEMQRTIREQGQDGMPAESHQKFVQYHEQEELLPPDVPGRALAALALEAPHEWSGEFLQWNEERVQTLVLRRKPSAD